MADDYPTIPDMWRDYFASECMVVPPQPGSAFLSFDEPGDWSQLLDLTVAPPLRRPVLRYRGTVELNVPDFVGVTDFFSRPGRRVRTSDLKPIAPNESANREPDQEKP